MYAVLINEQSLDLIATNNGGVKPDAEAWGGYFILPANPNDHAEIVSAEVFDRNYVIIGSGEFIQFQPIRPILQFELRKDDTDPYDESKAAYTIDRERLAQMVAAHTSGAEKAMPEQEDFDIADQMLTLLESLLIDTCPRCGGDHSWCQNVQPGEFGPE